MPDPLIGKTRLPRVTKPTLFWGLALFGLFTVLGLLASLTSYSSQLKEGRDLPVGSLLRQEFRACYACLLMTVCVLWVCRRNPLKTGRATRWVAVHLGFALPFSVLYAIGVAWLNAGEPSVVHSDQILTVGYILRIHGFHFVVVSFIIYWMTVFGNLGWRFYGRYRQREVETANLQRALTEARLETLRMQLNPHFLFNTLHAVSALIHDDPEAADRVVARLSELLRLSLDQTKPQEVPLREELAFLDGYLEIEQARFSDHLKVQRDVDKNVEEALVPYLVLQPLVENAIRHGIESREDQGCVAIRARRAKGRLELRIEDNGSGLAGGGSEPPREGIGLSNTRSRLRHLYGDNFRLELNPAAGGGLEALIDLPYHTAALPERAAVESALHG